MWDHAISGGGSAQRQTSGPGHPARLCSSLGLGLKPEAAIEASSSGALACSGWRNLGSGSGPEEDIHLGSTACRLNLKTGAQDAQALE